MGKPIRRKFKVLKAYLKSDWGYKVIMLGKDGMHSTIKRRLTKESADNLAWGLDTAFAQWKKYAKAKARKTPPGKKECPSCKGSGEYDGSACVRCSGGYVTSDVTSPKGNEPGSP